MANEQEELWLRVIAKSLSVLAMHRAELGNSGLVERAAFLEGLGMPRSDVATMLDSSVDSLSVMLRRKKKKRGRKSAKKGGKKVGKNG